VEAAESTAGRAATTGMHRSRVEGSTFKCCVVKEQAVVHIDDFE
jgi:hypothetical protein